MTDTQGTNRTFLIRRRFADGDEYLTGPHTWQLGHWDGAAEYAGVDEAVNTARQHGDDRVELIDGGRIEVVELIDGEPGPAMWAMGAAMPDLDVACAESASPEPEITDGLRCNVVTRDGGLVTGVLSQAWVMGRQWLKVEDPPGVWSLVDMASVDSIDHPAVADYIDVSGVNRELLGDAVDWLTGVMPARDDAGTAIAVRAALFALCNLGRLAAP